MSVATEALYSLAATLGIPWLRRRSGDAGAVVFAFHNVTDAVSRATPRDWPLHLSCADFARHLDWISDAFRVVPLYELAARAVAGLRTRGLAALTFDDAYRGVLAHALPELRQRGLPSTLFVVSGASSSPGPFWWDVLEAGSRLSEVVRVSCLNELQGDGARVVAALAPEGWPNPPDDCLPCSWRVLRDTAAADVTIGAHTVSHRNLLALPESEAWEELTDSRARIAAELGAPPSLHSYPYGLISRPIAEAARRAGYAAAVTLQYGWVRPGDDPYALRRVNVPAGMSTEKLDCWAGGLRWIGSR